jgi:hypothetical protein
MATNYPTALDSAAALKALRALRGYGPNNADDLFDALIDAVIALETKVAITGTAPTLSAGAQIPVGAVAAAVALGLGATAAEGLQLKIIDEVVSLAAAGAKFKAMTNAVPSGAVILAVQANINTLAVAGGTSVKVGLGDHTGTCNTYGNTSALTKNLKINTMPTYAILSGALTLEVCACASTATGLGDTNFSAGAVRVRIVYLANTSLADA